MGLTASSTGSKLLQSDMEKSKEKCDYSVAIAGNPNVREIYDIQWTNWNEATYRKLATAKL